MPKALLLENIHPDAAKSLRDHGFEVETMKGALNEDELIISTKAGYEMWAGPYGDVVHDFEDLAVYVAADKIGRAHV